MKNDLQPEIIKKINPADLPVLETKMDAALKKHSGFFCEFSAMVKNRTINFMVIAEPVMDSTGQPYAFKGILQDITEQKTVKQELIMAREKAIESEKQFRTLLDYAPEPIYILIDFKFVYVNLAALKLYGAKDEKEIMGSTIFDRLHPEAKEAAMLRLKDLNEINKSYNSVESKHTRLDGSPIEVEVSSVPIRFNNSNANLVIIKDIHERYQAQKALKHSHDLMSYIIHHNRSAIAVHDRDLNYIFVSRRYLNDYKISDPNIIGKHHYEVFPDLPQKWRDVHQRSLKGEVISAENDQYIRDDGSMEWTRWESRPWFEADGSIGGIIIYTEVITDRKVMEDTLRETNAVLLQAKQKAEASEKQFRLLLDNAPVPMFIQLDNRFIYVNKALIHVYKAANESELLGTPIADRIFPEYRQLVKERIKQLNEDKVPVSKIEYKHLALDNSELDVEVSAVPIEFNGENGALVFVNDITSRKRTELELKQSFELLSNLAEQVPGVIYQYRLYPDGRSAFPYSSAGMYEIYDVASEEVREDATPVFTRLHPDDYQFIVDTIMESARNQSLYHSEFRVVLPVQGVRWRSCFAKPELLNDGSTLWHGIITDITERKNIEKELEIKNEELNTFFDCALDLLGIATTEGYFLRLNKEWENVLGYSVEELQSRKFIDFIHPDDVKPTLDIIQKLSGQNQISSFINRYRCKNGGYKWIEWKSYPKGNKVYAAARDVTDRMLFETELEERIQTRTRELMNANKELEAFSYSVSHDLRSPLRAIIGYTNILLEEYESMLDDEGKRICHVISSSAGKMGKLIDDLLSFSRLSRNELVFTRFDMKELIHSIYQENTTAENKQRIEFVVDELPLSAGDYNMLKQVWINLISNAVKYSSKNEKAFIQVGFKENPNEFEYFIRDNGVGFDMQYANKLFGVFQRLHNSRDFEGTGVGLAIVQRIINRHGGKVHAESKLGEGATFYFSLPKDLENEEF
jgi:PAS domain S-box-containing protein